jgi:hypothetical protein
MKNANEQNREGSLFVAKSSIAAGNLFVHQAISDLPFSQKHTLLVNRLYQINNCLGIARQDVVDMTAHPELTTEQRTLSLGNVEAMINDIAKQLKVVVDEINVVLSDKTSATSYQFAGSQHTGLVDNLMIGFAFNHSGGKIDLEAVKNVFLINQNALDIPQTELDFPKEWKLMGIVQEPGRYRVTAVLDSSKTMYIVNGIFPEIGKESAVMASPSELDPYTLNAQVKRDAAGAAEHLAALGATAPEKWRSALTEESEGGIKFGSIEYDCGGDFDIAGIRGVASSHFGAKDVLGLEEAAAAVTVPKEGVLIVDVKAIDRSGEIFIVEGVRHVVAGHSPTVLHVRSLPPLEEVIQMPGITPGSKEQVLGRLRQIKLDIGDSMFEKQNAWDAIPLPKVQYNGNVRAPLPSVDRGITTAAQVTQVHAELTEACRAASGYGNGTEVKIRNHGISGSHVMAKAHPLKLVIKHTSTGPITDEQIATAAKEQFGITTPIDTKAVNTFPEGYMTKAYAIGEYEFTFDWIDDMYRIDSKWTFDDKDVLAPTYVIHVPHPGGVVNLDNIRKVVAEKTDVMTLVGLEELAITTYETGQLLSEFPEGNLVLEIMSLAFTGTGRVRSLFYQKVAPAEAGQKTAENVKSDVEREKTVSDDLRERLAATAEMYAKHRVLCPCGKCQGAHIGVIKIPGAVGKSLLSVLHELSAAEASGNWRAANPFVEALMKGFHERQKAEPKDEVVPVAGAFEFKKMTDVTGDDEQPGVTAVTFSIKVTVEGTLDLSQLPVVNPTVSDWLTKHRFPVGKAKIFGSGYRRSDGVVGYYLFAAKIAGELFGPHPFQLDEDFKNYVDDFKSKAVTK